MSKNDITAAETAYAQVQSTIQALRTSYDETIAEIAATEAARKSLSLAPVPLEDLKAGLLDFVDAAGKRYLYSVVRANIAQFAKGGRADEAGRQGRPLRFRDIEGAVSGDDPVLASERLFQQRLGEFNDQVLSCVFSEAIKGVLRGVMADMTPAEFGYDKLDPHEIGTDRETRRAAIREATLKLTELDARRENLTRQLCGLGFSLNGSNVK